MSKKKEPDQQMKKKHPIGFQVVEDECVWMKAGVVNFRLCDNTYDCYNCPFDEGMQRTMGSGDHAEIELREPGWVEHLNTRYQAAERPCRHTLMGRIDAPKICPLNYECAHCAFDKIMDKNDLAQLSDPPDTYLASGYKMAKAHYYHLGHCWVRFERGGRVRIGFDDFIVRLFGAFDFLALPPIGATLKKDQAGLTFGRDDYRGVALSPLTGTVLAVNHQVREHPEIAHKDPYHEGWLCVLEPEMPKKSLRGLYYGKESMQWMEQEAHKLLDLIVPEYEQLAATGGQPISDVFGNFPELEWDLLVKAFLRTEKIPGKETDSKKEKWSRWSKAIS